MRQRPGLRALPHLHLIPARFLRGVKRRIGPDKQLFFIASAGNPRADGHGEGLAVMDKRRLLDGVADFFRATLPAASAW